MKYLNINDEHKAYNLLADFFREAQDLEDEDQEEVDRINKNHVISLNNLRMGLEEFKEEYRKKTIGEPHTLTYH